MKLTTPIVYAALLAAIVADPSEASEAVWSQPWNSNWTAIESTVTTRPASNTEVADDFEVHGTIERIVVTGYDCFNCAPPTVTGVYVRMYEWSANGPGSLTIEHFLPAGDAGFLYNASGPATLDITLPVPFEADGRHFISVQLAMSGSGYWGWWISNYQSPRGSAIWHRNNAEGPGLWGPCIDVLGQNINSDLAFLLWGSDDTPLPPGADPCGQWTVLETPNPENTTHAIVRDVVALAPDDIYAVGEYTKTVQGTMLTLSMMLHYDGSAWSVIPSPNPAGCDVCAHVTFDAVAAAGPNDIWAAGGKRVQGPDGFVGTHLFVARYDGSQWTVMNTPLTTGSNGSNVRDIEVVSANDIWFFGDWTGAGMGGSFPALAMHWNGSSFTVHETPFPSQGTPGWATVAGSALSADDIWAVGGGSDGDYAFKSYIIHYNGSAWSYMPGPSVGTYSRLYDVKAIAPNDVWAVGDYFQAGAGYFPLFLHWDGSAWTQVPSSGGGRGLVAFSADHLYSGGAGIVHWDGRSWQQVESFNSVIGPSVAAMTPLGMCSIMAVGRQILVGNVLNFTARLDPVLAGEFTVVQGDVNGDTAVTIADLLAVVSAWGPCPAGEQCQADVTGDGVVGIADLLMVIGNWS